MLLKEGVDWIHLTQDRAQWAGTLNAMMGSRGPQKAGNFLTS
jgi:hypothetical protein